MGANPVLQFFPTEKDGKNEKIAVSFSKCAIINPDNVNNSVNHFLK